MDQHLKDQICSLIDLLEQENSINSIESSGIAQQCPELIEAQKTFEEFSEQMPNINKLLQLREMNTTIDITMDNFSFIGENVAATNKYLTIDSFNEQFHDLIQHNTNTKIDVQKMNKFVELNRQLFFQKFNDKLTRKLNRLEYSLGLMESILK